MSNTSLSSSQIIGSLRQSALLGTYGPGAIVDLRTRNGPISVIIQSLEQWLSQLRNPSDNIIREPRLEKILGVHGFVQPPFQDNPEIFKSRNRIPVTRFPEWYQCPKCKKIGHYTSWHRPKPTSIDLYCIETSCKSVVKAKQLKTIGTPVSPLRFIACCDKGHISDFPWHNYVRHKDDCSVSRVPAIARTRRFKLRLFLDGGLGLGNLYVQCLECLEKRAIGPALNTEGNRGGGLLQMNIRCEGKHPWRHLNNNEPCQCTKHYVLQKGASNLYFSSSKTALSIPPWDNHLIKALGHYWDSFATLLDPSLETVAENYTLIKALPVFAFYKKKRGIDDQRMIEDIYATLINIRTESDDLLFDEYKLLRESTVKRIDSHDSPNFWSYPVTVPREISSIFNGISRITKLREVRALTGFSRINPVGSTDSTLVELSSEPLQWLPGIENFGEGIYFQINSDTLKLWEARQETINQFSHLSSHIEALQQDGTLVPIPDNQLEPRFTLIHTISHILIKGLSIQCGYSMASLRERIYASTNPEMNGFLIYTSSPSSDGTLGGLESLAKRSNFGDLINHSFLSAEWCAADPLCSARSFIKDTLSWASCHNCVLISETSCEVYNRLLDRKTVYHERYGFLACAGAANLI